MGAASILDSGISAASATYAPAIPYTGQVGSMSDDQINQTAKDFESMFIGQMLEPMFGDSEGTDAFGSSESNDVYKGLLMEQYGKLITQSGGIGVADYVRKELLKLQESAHTASSKIAAKNPRRPYGSQDLQED